MSFRLRTTDYWFQTIDYRLKTTDYRRGTTDSRLQTTDHRSKTTEHRPQTADYRHRLQTIDCQLQAIDYRTQTTDHRLWTTGRTRAASCLVWACEEPELGEEEVLGRLVGGGSATPGQRRATVRQTHHQRQPLLSQVGDGVHPWEHRINIYIEQETEVVVIFPSPLAANRVSGISVSQRSYNYFLLTP